MIKTRTTFAVKPKTIITFEFMDYGKKYQKI